MSNKLFIIEDSILEKILKKVISKISNMLDEKISNMLDEKYAKFEHSLRNGIVILRNDLNSVKDINKKELSIYQVRKSVNDIEDSQNVLGKEIRRPKRKDQRPY